MKKKTDQKALTTKLLAWYDENQRILPWRIQLTPYAVWVSEIMLQQTRIEAVIPYYERFMNELPTLVDLAQCEDDRLMKLWEGLGYYHRVRNMKRCAIECMETYHGNLPADVTALRKLPGIGEYTAGAIGSIAYDLAVCAIDGNVLRVFSRILCSDADISLTATKKQFHSIIREYLPRRSGAFNQALMELGERICIPNGVPHCAECPIHAECLAYQNGCQLLLPVNNKKKTRTLEEHTVLILICDQRVHLIKRPKSGLLADLYQFDFLDGFCDEAKLRKYAQTYGEVQSLVPLPDTHHIFTHKEWHMHGWLAVCKMKQQRGLWANRTELAHTYAIASAFAKYKEICFAYLAGGCGNESTTL